MNYMELFNRLEKFAKENDLAIKIETERNSNYAFEIWVYSYKYAVGKHMSINELTEIEKIDFAELAAVKNINESVSELTRLGYSKDDIANKFNDAIYGTSPTQVAV